MTDQSDAVEEMDDLLRSLINTLIDGQEGYRTIGQDLKDDEVKRFFLAESVTRAAFQAQLEGLLHQIDIQDVDESGTVVGTVHRTWGDIKARLGGSDHTLLETAEQGEKVAVHAYAQALEKELVLPIRRVLLKQHAHVLESYDYVKAMRKAAE